MCVLWRGEHVRVITFLMAPAYKDPEAYQRDMFVPPRIVALVQHDDGTLTQVDASALIAILEEHSDAP